MKNRIGLFYHKFLHTKNLYFSRDNIKVENKYNSPWNSEIYATLFFSL